MGVLMSDLACPCRSSKDPEPYDLCCGRFHAGAPAETAEQLMRSRYSAFVRQDQNYLLATWHSRTRPKALELDPSQRWLGLKIVATSAGAEGDSKGTVSFVARYKLGSRGYRIVENSTFERVDGRWVYVDGD